MGQAASEQGGASTSTSTSQQERRSPVKLLALPPESPRSDTAMADTRTRSTRSKSSKSPPRTTANLLVPPGTLPLRAGVPQPAVHRALSANGKQATILGVQSLEQLQKAVAEAKAALEAAAGAQRHGGQESRPVFPNSGDSSMPVAEEGGMGNVHSAESGDARSFLGDQTRRSDRGSLRLKDSSLEPTSAKFKAKEAVRACREAVDQCKEAARAARNVEVAEAAEIGRPIVIPIPPLEAGTPTQQGILCAGLWPLSDDGCEWCSREETGLATGRRGSREETDAAKIIEERRRHTGFRGRRHTMA